MVRCSSDTSGYWLKGEAMSGRTYMEMTKEDLSPQLQCVRVHIAFSVDPLALNGGLEAHPYHRLPGQRGQ